MVFRSTQPRTRVLFSSSTHCTGPYLRSSGQPNLDQGSCSPVRNITVVLVLGHTVNPTQIKGPALQFETLQWSLSPVFLSTQPRSRVLLSNSKHCYGPSLRSFSQPNLDQGSSSPVQQIVLVLILWSFGQLKLDQGSCSPVQNIALVHLSGLKVNPTQIKGSAFQFEKLHWSNSQDSQPNLDRGSCSPH